MATANLSAYDKTTLPDARSMRIGIVVSEWNSDITNNLFRGCMEALTDCGVSLDNIHVVHVPGSFELPVAADMILRNTKVESVICLGSVIRGETPHFEFISQACATAVQQVAIKHSKPVIFGVLTDNTLEQSRERSGGSKGNKGVEAGITAIRMIDVCRELEEKWI
jgi:6,7-dimethyl-8-ribityllumazine synthase